MNGFEIQSIQRHLCLKLSIYTIKLHSHTPAIKDVPLTGIHSTYHLKNNYLSYQSTKLAMVFGGYTLVAFQTFFHGRTPEIIFHIPRKPYLCKCLQTGKERGSFWGTYITQVFPISPYICPLYFDG